MSDKNFRVKNGLEVGGPEIDIAQGTTIAYSENNDRTNRPGVQSTTGNSSGLRVVAPNATTSASSTLSVTTTNDLDNTKFLNINARGNVAVPFRITTGEYVAGVLGAAGDAVTFVDGTTTYATVNPAGPTDPTDLTTKSYVDALPANITYTIDASSTTGGANLNLTGSDATTDTVKLSNGGHVTATYTSATEVTLGSDATSANTADTIVARDASGNFVASGATLGNVTVGIDTDQVVSTTSGNLVLQTAAGVSAGTVTLAAGANGAITVAPNGTGDAAFTFNNGGNLTNTRNYVFGTIRNATTDSIGDIWALNSTGPVSPYRGISLDNSADTTKGPGTVMRSFSGGAVNGNATRSRVVFEKSRGTSASPTALAAGDLIGSIDATGYTSTGWVSDNVVAAIPGFISFGATESWVSNTNLGTTFALTMAPQATTITTAANLVNVINAQPEVIILKGDRIALAQAKTIAFNATGCSTSGTTLTIGTLVSGTIAIGQVIQLATGSPINGQYIIANISGSGSGSTWTLSGTPGTLSGLTVNAYTGFLGGPNTGTTVDALQNLRLIKNTIVGSNGTTQIVTSAGGTTLDLRGDTVTIDNAANTATYATFGASSTQLAASGTNYASLTAGGTTFTTSGRMNVIRTTPGTGILLRQQTANTDPVNNDEMDFRLSIAGTVTSSDFARFDGTYKSSGDNEIGMSVSADSFATDTDRIYVGSRASTRIRTTPAGGGTAGDTATFTQLATTIKSDAVTLQTAAGVSLVGTNISYNRVFGQWQYDATLTPAAANTAYAVPFQGTNAVTDFANIASAASTSRIIPGAAGMFKLQFSAQVENSDNGADHQITFWWRKNGTDISNSAGYFTVPKAGAATGALIVGWDNMVQTANTTDYFELIYAVSDTALTLPFIAAAAPRPGAASVFLTLVPVGA